MSEIKRIQYYCGRVDRLPQPGSTRERTSRGSKIHRRQQLAKLLFPSQCQEILLVSCSQHAGETKLDLFLLSSCSLLALVLLKHGSLYTFAKGFLACVYFLGTSTVFFVGMLRLFIVWVAFFYVVVICSYYRDTVVFG